MMETQLLWNIGLLLFFAILGGIISTRLKQPVVLGLLVVGTLIGPNMLGLVHNPELINLFIDFGTILFLFTIGMEFSLKKLSDLGGKSLLVAFFKVGFMFFIGFLTTVLLGLDVVTAAFVGVAFSFSSTMIITSVLKQKNLINKQEVPLLIAVSIIEDIFGVIALTFFAAAQRSGGALALVAALERIVISLAILIAVYFVLSRFAESIINWVQRNAPEETILFSSLLLCSGFSYLAFTLGLAPSVGAFLAGSVIANFQDLKAHEHSLQSYNYMFTAFFFIAMGTMIDLAAVFSNLGILLVFLIALVIGLVIAVGLVTKIFAGYSTGSAIFSTVVMLPLGVFSLLVAKQSQSFGVSLDLVSIISVMILVLSVVLSVFSTKTNLISKHMDFYRTGKKSPLERTMRNIVDYFETLFMEFRGDNAHTRRAKRSIEQLGLLLIALIAMAILGRRILTALYGTNPALFYTLGLVVLLGLGILGYYFVKKAKKTQRNCVKVIGMIDGGLKLKRIHDATTNILIATGVSIVALFSPLLIFLLRLPTGYVFGSLGLLLVGVFYYIKAGAYLENVSYHATVQHEYKKFVVKK